MNARPVLLPHPAQHHQPPGGGMFNNVGGGVRTQPPSNNPPPLMSIMTLHPDIQQQSNNPSPGLRGVAPPANNGGGNIRLPDFTQPPPTMLRPMPPPPQPQQQSPLQIQQKTHQVWSLPQFYSVDFSQSRIGIKKCVFYKRTIKVCVSCC